MTRRIQITLTAATKQSTRCRTPLMGFLRGAAEPGALLSDHALDIERVGAAMPATASQEHRHLPTPASDEQHLAISLICRK